MIKRFIDYAVSCYSPERAVRRAHARRVERYQGGETSRLNASRPKNQSANSELAGPWGADSLRAWARKLVRDNPYAWSALESIVSEVIGSGFKIQSALESETGEDEPDTNENRDKTWDEWCEVCDINGELTFDEIQVLAFREMVEAGEALIHYITVPLTHNGIRRPVPLALELIEADRLASDHDTYAIGKNKEGIRITRGVEMDMKGRVLAYWIYPAHPTEPNVYSRVPERIEARYIKHLFRKDRIGQGRGVSWFAPVVNSFRNLDTYLENEQQRAAVQSCYTAAITTESGNLSGLGLPSTDDDTTDSNGNTYEYIEPGLIMQLNKGESIDFGSPSSPNANAEPWIALMVRGFAAGTGTSYESISKDFSNTSYSSSRTSKLENRPRYRRWQRYWGHHCCLETWDRFCNAAAQISEQRPEFPTHTELLEGRRTNAPVEIMSPEWEWVDLTAEQQASENAVAANQKSETEIAGSRGVNNRRLQRQIAKDKQLRMKLGEEFGVDMRTRAEASQVADLAEETKADAAVKTAEAAEVTAETKTEPGVLNGQT